MATWIIPSVAGKKLEGFCLIQFAAVGRLGFFTGSLGQVLLQSIIEKHGIGRGAADIPAVSQGLFRVLGPAMRFGRIFGRTFLIFDAILC